MPDPCLGLSQAQPGMTPHSPHPLPQMPSTGPWLSLVLPVFNCFCLLSDQLLHLKANV